MTKLSKILQRLTTKGSERDQDLGPGGFSTMQASASAKRILAASDKKTDRPMSPRSIGSPADGSRKDTVAGVKRLREGDAAAQPSRQENRQSDTPILKPLAYDWKRRESGRSCKACENRGKDCERCTNNGCRHLCSNPAAKAKVAVAAPPKSSIFAALSSVPKKPGTSNAERAAAAAKDKAAPSNASSSVLARPIKKESPPGNDGTPPIAKSATSSSFLWRLA